MIFEAILGVTGAAGTRFAPMGVVLEGEWPACQATVRPYRTSRTGALFAAVCRGVLNFTDDVYLFAQTALTEELPPARGNILEGACEWWEVTVKRAESADASAGDRCALVCDVVASGLLREFSPFNRGRNAVLEAAVLATRLDILPDARERIAALADIVAAAGGEREIAAYKLIKSRI